MTSNKINPGAILLIYRNLVNPVQRFPCHSMSAAKKKSAPKKNIAARLHDTVAQELTAAAILAHVHATRLERAKHPEAANANALLEKVTLASTQLREIMLEINAS